MSLSSIRLRGEVPAWLKTGEKTSFGLAGRDFDWERVGTFTDAEGNDYVELRSNPAGTIYLVPILDISAYMVGRKGNSQ